MLGMASTGQKQPFFLENNKTEKTFNVKAAQKRCVLVAQISVRLLCPW